MSNVKAPSSNKIQSPNKKIWRRRGILTLNHFDIDLSFGFWPERAPQALPWWVKGHNMNKISSPGNPALQVGGFTFELFSLLEV